MKDIEFYFNEYVLITELIWKVARCTSAAPCYFKPMNNFIDGGLRVNNPSEDGMTKIQSYLKETSPRTDLMLVVSIGCGVFPPQELGDVDIEKYLFFGKHWMKPWKLVENVRNLIHLLAEGVNIIFKKLYQCYVFMYSINPQYRSIILKVLPETHVVVVKGNESPFIGLIQC